MFASPTELSFSTQSQRAWLVALLVGATASVIVYFSNDWFRTTFLVILGIGAPLGDAFGALLIILTDAAKQQLMSLALFCDTLLGITHQQESPARQYLWKFLFSTLKIDRSFVMAMTDDP